MRVAWSLLAAALVLLLAPAASAQCASDADCRGTRACIEGTCQARPCAVDIDCPDPQICEQGVCVKDTFGAPAPTPPPVVDPTTPTTPKATDPAPEPPKRRIRRRRIVDYRIEERSIPGLWIPGIVVTGVTYAITIPLGLALNDGGTFSLVPIIGPWLMLSVDDSGAPLWVTSGVVQASGLAMIILGVALTREVKIPVYEIGQGPDAPQLSIMPTAMGQGGAGLTLTLTRF